MHKQRIHVLFIVTSLLCASSQVLWVNQSYTANDSDGSQTKPYSSLNEAFDSISQDSLKDTQILIANDPNTSPSYSLGQCSIPNSLGTSLKISSSNTLISYVSESSQNCQNLPQIIITDSSSLSFSPSPSTTGQASDISFHGVRLTFRVDNQTSQLPSFVFSNTMNVTLTSVCIDGVVPYFLSQVTPSSTMMQPNMIPIFSINATTLVQFSDIVFMIEGDFTIFIFGNENDPNVSISNVSYILSLTEQAIQPFFNISDVFTLNLSNISILPAQNQEITLLTPRFVDTNDVLEINLVNLTFANCNFTLFDYFMELIFGASAMIQKIEFTNATIQVNTSLSMNISLIHILIDSSFANSLDSLPQSITVNEVSISNSTFTSNATIMGLLTGDEFQIFNLDFGESDPNVTLTEMKIISSSLGSSFLLLNSSATLITNFLMSDFMVQESNFTGYYFLNFKFLSEEVHRDTIIWKEMNNIYIANSIFTPTYLLGYVCDGQTDSKLGVFDFEYFKLNNMSMQNTSFVPDAYNFSSTVIYLTGTFLSIDNLTYIHNFHFLSTTICTLKFPGHIFISSSLIRDNGYFDSWGFIYDQLISSTDFYFMMGSDFQSPNGASELTRALFIYNTTIQRNDNLYQSAVMTMSFPFVYILDSKFIDIKTDDLAGCLSLTGFTPPDYTVFGWSAVQQNNTLLEIIYADFPLFLNFRMRNTPGAAGIPSSHYYYYLMENLQLSGFQMRQNSYFIQLNIGFVAAPIIGTHLYGCLFEGAQGEGGFSSSNVIFGSSLYNVRIDSCVFKNMADTEYGILLKDLYTPSTFIFTSNIIESVERCGILSLETQGMEGLTISNNTLRNLDLNNYGIELSITRVSSIFNVSDLTTTNVTLHLELNRVDQLNFIHIQISEVTDSALISISDVLIDTVNMIDEGALSSFDNSLVLVSIDIALYLQNIILENVKVNSENYLLSLSAVSVTVSECVFDSITMNNTHSLLSLITGAMMITNSSFSNYAGASTGDGSIFHVNGVGQSQKGHLIIDISNTSFEGVTAYESPILSLSNVILELSLQNNIFNGVGAAQRGAFIFESCNFTTIAIDSTQIELTVSNNAYESSLFEFSNCATSQVPNSLFLISNTNVTVSTTTTGTFLTLTSCSGLPLQVVNLTKSYVTFNTGKQRRGRILSSQTNSGSTQYSLLDASFSDITIAGVSVSNLQYIGTSLFILSCLTQQQASSLLIQNSSFSNLVLKNQSGVATSVNTHIIESSTSSNTIFCGHQITLNSSIFFNVSAEGPGAVIYDQQIGNITSSSSSNQNSGNTQAISLIGCKFVDISSLEGGVKYSNSNLSKSTSVLIANCHFQNLSAIGRGGSFWFNYVNLQVIDSIFENNSALSGAAIWTENPDMITSTLISNLSQNNHNPDDLVNAGPNFLLIDLGNQSIIEMIMYGDGDYGFSNVTSYSFQNLKLEITLATNLQNGSIQSVLDNSNTAIMTFTFYLPQGINYTLSALCQPASPCQIPGISATLPAEGGDYGTLVITYHSTRFSEQATGYIRFRDCVPGEVKDETNRLCKLCDDSQYSLQPNESCQTCPANAQCAQGSIVSVSEGYWRPNILSDKVYDCNDTKNPRCLGGYPGSNCKLGFIGDSCLQCDTSLNYVADDTDYTACKLCNNTSGYPTLFLYTILALIYQTGFLVSSYHRKKREFQDYLTNDNSHHTRASLDAYIKILLLYVQLVSVVMLVSSIIYSYISATEAISLPTVQVVGALDCILLKLNYSIEEIYKLKIIATLFSPIAKLALCALVLSLVYAVNKHLRKRSQFSSKEFISWISVCLCVLVNLEQPAIISYLTSYISCQKLYEDGNSNFLAANRNVSCDSEDYYFFKYLVVVPGIFFWGFLLPIALFLILLKNKKHLYTSERIITCLGSLYLEYKPERFYWGLVLLILKNVIYILSYSIQIDVALKGLTIAQILGVYFLMLEISGNPYNDRNLFRCEKLIMSVCSLTLLYSLYFLNSESFQGLEVWSFVALLGANLLLFIYLVALCLFLIAQGTLRKHKRKVSANSRSLVLGGIIYGNIQDLVAPKIKDTFLESIAKSKKRLHESKFIKFLKRALKRSQSSLKFIGISHEEKQERKPERKDEEESQKQIAISRILNQSHSHLMNFYSSESSSSPLAFNPRHSLPGKRRLRHQVYLGRGSKPSTFSEDEVGSPKNKKFHDP